MDPDVPLPTAKAGCDVNDGALRADLEHVGPSRCVGTGG